MNFDAQRSESDEGHSCEEGPDCRFRSLGEGGKKRVGKKVKPPKKKKAKKAALPPSQRGSSSHPIARSLLRVPRSPQESSVNQEQKEENFCGEERTFMVRVRAGEAQAEVLFLNEAKREGWEGPFGLDLPIQGLLDFDKKPLPRRMATSEDPPSGKGKEESEPSWKEGEASSSGSVKEEPKPLTLDPYLTGERGAGLSDIMASARGEEPKKTWKDLTPIYEMGELVTFYDRYEGK